MKNQWKNYLGIGIAAFFTFAACALLFFLLYKIKEIGAFFGQVIGILEPILIGIVIAYLLNPVMNFFEKRIMLQLEKTRLEKPQKMKLARGLSVFLSVAFGVAVVATVFGLMIPQLITSLYGIARDMPVYLNRITDWVMDISKNNPEIQRFAGRAINEATEKINTWITSDMLLMITKYLGYVTTGVISAVSVVFNTIIGLIVAVYVLFSREMFAGQIKKMIYAVFSPEKANIVLHMARKSNRIFGGFISGKILDSAIIGILCFICLSFMNMPYTLLVSVIVGVTNVIPFFGPYIGAIPSALLILMVNPLKALYFIIFIIILQQVDGNIIGPTILGESTGLSAFWVVFSILLGSGLFGVMGMIMGVPTFAVIYYIVKTLMEHILKKKEYPVDSSEYVYLKSVEKGQKFVYYEEEEIKNRPKFFKLSFEKLPPKDNFFGKKKNEQSKEDERKDESKDQ